MPGAAVLVVGTRSCVSAAGGLVGDSPQRKTDVAYRRRLQCSAPMQPTARGGVQR